MLYVLIQYQKHGGKMGKRITHAYLLKVLNYDSVLGSFTWRADIAKKAKAGNPAGSAQDGKFMVGLNGELHFGHRLAWFYVHGAWPEGYVVPINGNFLDLRLENLKCESRAEAVHRSKVRSTSSSGVTGVSWNTRDRKWVASVTINYRQINLGSFSTIEEAKSAYDEAKLNAPTPDPQAVQKKRVAIALKARQRRAWKHAVDENGNSAWRSFDDFVKDVGSPPRDGSILAPIDATLPIGPGNFTWVRRARFDHKTADGRRAYQRQARNDNFERYRAVGLRKSFGLEANEYQEMHDRQGGVCAICRKPETGKNGGFPIHLAVDHNHVTGAIRGLLCRGCNHGIANFKEDLDRLRKAVAYLEHHAELESESTLNA